METCRSRSFAPAACPAPILGGRVRRPPTTPCFTGGELAQLLKATTRLAMVGRRRFTSLSHPTNPSAITRKRHVHRRGASIADGPAGHGSVGTDLEGHGAGIVGGDDFTFLAVGGTQGFEVDAPVGARRSPATDVPSRPAPAGLLCGCRGAATAARPRDRAPAPTGPPALGRRGHPSAKCGGRRIRLRARCCWRYRLCGDARVGVAARAWSRLRRQSGGLRRGAA